MKKNIDNEKIDFVLIWVDGNDPEWQREKEKYSPNKNTDSRNIRYRDWDNLKYWFRGVEKFAPWVNKIYFVTCGHYPKWLNKENPKLVCIKHEDFIPKEYLPTFSSHTIELNLHRIKGLSEKFVYFNDDIFLLKKTKENDFFKKNKAREISVFSPVAGDDELFVSVCNNVNLIINRHFKKNKLIKENISNFLNLKYGNLNIRTLLCLPFHRILGFYETHSCNAYNKKIFEIVWKKEYDALNNTCKNKFRNKNDVNQYLIKQWQICSNETIPTTNNKKTVRIFDNIEYACKLITQKKAKILCLNDSESTEREFEKAKEKIKQSFEKILPDKSSFEK